MQADDAKTPDLTTYDVKKDRKDLYAPRAGLFSLVEVPAFGFLMIDGAGDPNATPDYPDAVGALYTAAYSVRALAKSGLGRVHTVAPLEGLWSAADPAAFVARDKSAWHWTLMIAQPEWITPELARSALAAAIQKKGLPALERVRFQRLAEGRCVQTLHVGPYDDEGPTLARLHDEFMPEHGLTFNGRHHEIYLSDARKTEPARLRTILRQPVRPVSN